MIRYNNFNILFFRKVFFNLISVYYFENMCWYTLLYLKIERKIKNMINLGLNKKWIKMVKQGELFFNLNKSSLGAFFYRNLQSIGGNQIYNHRYIFHAF